MFDKIRYLIKAKFNNTNDYDDKYLITINSEMNYL